ncbi:MAG: HAD family phosphatase [Acidobacteria bacterium]|nr:MAG: HAD family phosphatase [Acidobacteriota bacterium]
MAFRRSQGQLQAARRVGFAPPDQAQTCAVQGLKTSQELFRLLRAIIFDFDGILVNSEPLILKLTQEMAAKEGWTITEEEYYRDYLALDDRGIVEHLYRSHGRSVDHGRRDELVDWKARAYWELIRDGLPPLPGAVEFVGKLAAQYPLAIASGSFRVEIEHLLGKIGLREAFQVLVTADDVERSKPEPDAFLKALHRLRQLPELGADAGKAALDPANCLVIEDAPAGVRAAHAAGMKCLALAHTRPLVELRHADWARRDFGEVDLEEIARAFQNSGE